MDIREVLEGVAESGHINHVKVELSSGHTRTVAIRRQNDGLFHLTLSDSSFDLRGTNIENHHNLTKERAENLSISFCNGLFYLVSKPARKINTY
jgi:hypothetical protein|tara:strand:+ start:266 stop:547 length:282 start_codon:yes stop_codon:yes gene_type:complete